MANPEDSHSVGVWRYPLAAAALVMAAAHVPVTEDHFHEAPYIGVLFVILEVAGVFLAIQLIRRERRVDYWLAAATGALAVAAYVVSRAVGLPQIHDDIGNWAEPLGVVSIVDEALLAVGCVVAVNALGRFGRARLPRPVAVLAAAALLVAGLGATAVAANAEDMTDGMSSPMPMTGSTYWAQVGGGAFHSDGVVRTYYIEADPVAWNYAPDGRNEITGKPFDTVARTYTAAGPDRIGSTYQKCLYRGYTNSSFKHRVIRDVGDAYLGLLGPVIHAEVGDTIKVVFHNTCSFPASMHPHGVFYTKSSEGAPYNDGTTGADKADDAVPTGGRHTYTWLVPPRAGPGPNDGSSVMWMYHSHTDEIADTYAGLMGPIVITRPGMARPDGSPKDVDKEVFSVFSIFNETLSPLLRENVRRYAEPPKDPNPPDYDDFVESNLKHSINGYLFGNMPMITLHKGERVRWYVMGMGTETDLHTPHWHGNDVVVNGMRMDVISLLPATMIVADMVPDNVGIWLFHCHVNDHIRAGMLTRYQVLPS
jgi:FtsP/CotA-like multicopper oxidase with cupredoxin domain